MDTGAGTFFGDVARYSCDTGYTLNGPAERTCQADGRWNGSVPTCGSELWDAMIKCTNYACDICMVLVAYTV